MTDVVPLSTPNLVVQSDPVHLAEFAAATMAAEIRQAVRSRGEAIVALPGGSTPRAALELLAIQPAMDWSKVVVVPGDERLVPVGDPESNERMIRESLVSRIPGPAPIVAGWGVEAGLGSETVVRRFEARLLGLLPKVDGLYRFDWLGLGLGEDGHTASLFPGREYSDEELVFATVHPSGQTRLTLGPSLLRSAHKVRFLLEGQQKADTLASVIDGPYDPVRWPAQLVARRVPGCEIWCDSAAAALARSSADG